MGTPPRAVSGSVMSTCGIDTVAPAELEIGLMISWHYDYIGDTLPPSNRIGTTEAPALLVLTISQTLHLVPSLHPTVSSILPRTAL